MNAILRCINFSHSSSVAALSRKMNVTFAMIDTCIVSRGLFDEAVDASYDVAAADDKDQWVADILRLLNALGDADVAKAFMQWLTSSSKDHAMSILIHVKSSLSPAATRIETASISDMVKQANAAREQVMQSRIMSLCGGDITGGKLRKSVVAVVGKGHVQPLRLLLEKEAVI